MIPQLEDGGFTIENANTMISVKVLKHHFEIEKLFFSNISIIKFCIHFALMGNKISA
jgi:hypothetical protein